LFALVRVMFEIISFSLFIRKYQRLNFHELNIKMLQPKIVPNCYDMHTHLSSCSEWNYFQPKQVPEGSTSCCRLYREFFLYFVQFQKSAYIKLTKTVLRNNINLKYRASSCHLRKEAWKNCM